MTGSPSEYQPALERALVQLVTAQRLAHMGTWETEYTDGGEVTMTWSAQTRQIAGWPDDRPEPGLAEFVATLHPDDRPQFLRARQAALHGDASYAIDCRLVRPDGGVRDVHLEAEIDRDQTGAPLRAIGIVQDVTRARELLDQLVAAENTRRQLLHRLMQSTDAERSRLAEDLHDGPVQVLSAVALRLEHLSAGGAGADDLAPVVGDVREVIQSLRTLLFELHPRALRASSIASAVEQLASAAIPHCELSVDVERALALDDEVSLAVVRIVQEALWNVGRHASASHVRVTLRAAARDVVLEIVDDGCGFDPGDPSAPGHLGLVAMQERAEAVGGTFTLRSRTTGAPTGTTISIRFPSV